MIRAMLEQYGAKVCAFTFAMIALCVFAFFMAFAWSETPVSTWEVRDDG